MPKRDGATEKATPQKVKQSRKEGQVVKSKETGNFFSFLAFFVGVFFFGEVMMKQMVGLVITGFDLYASGATPFDITLALGKKGALIFLIAVVVVLLFAFVNHMLLVGFLFSTKAFKPDIKRINPATYWKNVFNIRQLGMDLSRNLITLVVILAVVYNVYLNNMKTFSEAIFLPWLETLVLFEGIFHELLIKLGIAFFVVALVDYFYRRFEYNESLKMKKQEIKDEMKQNMGDPKIKEHQRRMMMRLLKQEVASKVPDGNVLIMNPTHYAVCIRYKRSKGDDFPRIIAKGVDNVALYMKELALEENIPVIENPPLARDLFARRKEGEFIPEDLFKVIAAILRELWEKNQIDIE